MTNEPLTPQEPQQPGQPQAPRDTSDVLHDRMESFGREAQAVGERFGRQAQAAGERFGREAQAAGERHGRDPGVVAAGTWFTRFWGLVLIGIGGWFFARDSLGLDLPPLDWDVLWPVALIVLGGIVITSGLTRRR